MSPSSPRLILVVFGIIACTAVLSADDADPKAKVVGPKIISEDEFSGKTNTTEVGLEQVQLSLAACVQREIRTVDQDCLLTDEQIAQLRRVAEDDFQVWLAYANQVRADYVGRPLDLMEERLAEIEMSFLRLRPSRQPVDRDSLFQRTLIDILTLEQMPGYDEYRRKQRINQLETVWKRLETRPHHQVKLSRTSRDRLTELLMEKAPPLPRNGEYAELIVILQMNDLKDQVMTILTDEEQTQYQAALHVAWGMELYLRGVKLWPVPKPEPR